VRAPVQLVFAVLALVWGTNFITSKWASDTLSAEQITLLRVLFGFLPVAAYALRRRALSIAHWRHAHHFLVMSVLTTSAHYFAFASGTALLPSGIAGALAGAVPLFSLLAAALFLRGERVSPGQMAGVAVGLLGVVLIARPWEASAVDAGGVAWMVVGSAVVGASFVYAKRFLVGLDIAPAGLTTYQLGLGLLTLALVTDTDGIGAITGDARALAGLVVGLGLLGSGVAYLLYYVLVGRLGAVTAASSTYLPPVIALAIGWLVAGERIDGIDALAAALILGGVLASASRPARWRARLARAYSSSIAAATSPASAPGMAVAAPSSTSSRAPGI
jgi:drug/metabolite transporter (DMT)-like permease